jgi:hypothetical protein
VKKEIIEQLRVIDEAHAKLLAMRESCPHHNLVIMPRGPAARVADKHCQDCGRFWIAPVKA